MFDFGIRNASTGYRVQYRRDQVNHCPGCGKSHWFVGRMDAECAFCGTALGIASNTSRGISALRVRIAA
jgi:uncharacterized protein (DUF983 family)